MRTQGGLGRIRSIPGNGEEPVRIPDEHEIPGGGAGMELMRSWEASGRGAREILGGGRRAAARAILGGGWGRGLMRFCGEAGAESSSDSGGWPEEWSS